MTKDFPMYVPDCHPKAKIYPALPPDKDPTPICSECHKICNPVQKKCLHKKTVAINEEGHAGVFCSDCGKQLEKEC